MSARSTGQIQDIALLEAREIENTTYLVLCEVEIPVWKHERIESFPETLILIPPGHWKPPAADPRSYVPQSSAPIRDRPFIVSVGQRLIIQMQ